MSDAERHSSRGLSVLPARRRWRWLLVVAAALVLAAATALYVWRPWAPQGLPEVSVLRAACPSATGEPLNPGTASAAQLVPEQAYSSVQLCPVAAGGGLTTRRLLTDDEARKLVRRLNALPASPPTTGCAGMTGYAVDLVLAEGTDTTWIRMDTAACGAVRGPGGTRYGGDQINEYVTGLLD
jgi:hypothetical protein